MARFLDEKLNENKKELIEYIKPPDPNIKKRLDTLAKSGFGVSNPSLITLDLITAKINKWKEENKVYSQEITHEGCTEIALSFSSILQISNLDNLISLETLRLDNNMIMKIENLDKLVNIKWLDLSFNYIQKIEGLNALVNLTDLSLFSNFITEVEGLDENRKLNVLSVGKNNITDPKKMAMYLKKFTNLQALCVHMNTFCKDEDPVSKMIEGSDAKVQDSFPISYDIILQNLKYLKYLDWKPLSKEQKERARQGGGSKEEKEDVAEAEEKKRKEEAELRKADLSEIIDFFKKVQEAFEEQISDFKGLLVIKGIESAINSTDKNISDEIERFKKTSLELTREKEEFKNKELKLIEKNEEKFIEMSKDLIRAFKRKFKEYSQRLERGEEDPNLTVVEVQKKIGLEQLKIDLLEIEVHVKEENKNQLSKFKSEVDERNKKLGEKADTLKSNLDAQKTNLKDKTNKAAQEAKAAVEAYNDRINGNEEEGIPEGDHNQSVAQAIGQHENDEENEKYMEKLRDLFGENRAGEVISEVEKIPEILEEAITRLRDNLEGDRNKSNKIFFDDLNNKEFIRNKKRIQDIIEIYKIYYDKIDAELQKVLKQRAIAASANA
ncbi:MAG: hypothetical protein MJ252_17435 [archaeon]|nr:hypothetical protein [archaeon]